MAADGLVSGVRVTHPDRVLFPAIGATKLDLVRHYDAVADWILPHLAGRPLTLKQCAPDADHCRFLRHSGERAPEHVRVVKIRELKKTGDYMIVDDRTALLSLAQRNIVEFHTWNARDGQVERPDRLVFDLDPGPDVDWRAMVTGAQLMRRALDELHLAAWLKTTGGKGLHVVVPIVPKHDWSRCLEFARDLAGTIAAHDPSRYTISFPKRDRANKILIDYLRNNRTNTSVAAYSVRARSTATVSVPVDWDELTPRLRPEKWTIRTILKRLSSGRDPWSDYFGARQQLP
jgi:bifunctional non-homologous end joining protein LigD